MEHKSQIQVPRVKLGTQGLEKRHKALKQLPREQVQLATKFGVVSIDWSRMEVKGTPDYVRQCCEASLKRLDVDYIDLFYTHRVDISVPIEDTMKMGELKKLVEEGKIKYIGLSEASVDTIRRAHAVHPITAVEMEYSLWTRDIEEDVIPLCRELGIGIVAYSPLGQGFFGGKAVVENLPAESVLAMHPKFTGENLEKNKILYARFAELAAKHGCSPPQLALAWLLHQGNDVVPIPGTTKIKNLDANIGSVVVKLTHNDLKEISDAIPVNEVGGKKELNLLFKFTYRVSKFIRLGEAHNKLEGRTEGAVLDKGIEQEAKNALRTVKTGNTSALKELPREQVQLATKCGIISVDWTHVEVKGTPDYVRQCCEASLKRLDVDYIDLFYTHRVDLSLPIEDTVSMSEDLLLLFFICN
ncbi:hypothetical protein HYC85_012968 [Camellia sinensis]|uniref:NADP-dependent oxidoreductase domain-containing protein n=1 Tax=Camellia sinensis TaxID=4442 RepID=A0A7J7HE99_CAMSI|nr:hypothetical protein HYC85_012968 [Camellia sinensis]